MWKGWAYCQILFKRSKYHVSSRKERATHEAPEQMGFAVWQTQAMVKLEAIGTRQSVLPRGLSGARCTAQVDIAGMTCDCLLDTGSQVTTITQFFYNRNLGTNKFTL